MKRQAMIVLRAQKGWTQAQVAKKLGTSTVTYNTVETGKRNGTREFWLRYQELFKLDGGQVWSIQNDPKYQI